MIVYWNSLWINTEIVESVDLRLKKFICCDKVLFVNEDLTRSVLETVIVITEPKPTSGMKRK